MDLIYDIDFFKLPT